eukprot:m.203187 g.203187  ORF g.203187 m.203187 type:complete len:465 (-) comp22037_c0_seq1:133-1527(-)
MSQHCSHVYPILLTLVVTTLSSSVAAAAVGSADITTKTLTTPPPSSLPRSLPPSTPLSPHRDPDGVVTPTAATCSYNGRAVGGGGACVCAPQWRGAQCDTLVLEPADRMGGFHSPHAPDATNTSSWGGSILHDATTGLWHMYSAEMDGDCGIGSWSSNSQVVHATAPHFTGPYSKRDVVATRFAHEPNAVRSPDGDWVIYMTMRHPPIYPLNNCSNGQDYSTHTPPARFPSHGVVQEDIVPQDTYMIHSKSPDGPWSEPVRVLRANTSKWDGRTVLIDTNLAVTITPSGGAVGIWRKCENTPGTVCENECCTFPHLLTATNWRDPSTYVAHGDVRIFPDVVPFGAEDPMVWTEANPDNASQEIIKAILHDEQGPSRNTAIGRYAFSDDGGATWTYASHDAYNGTVVWTDGSVTDLYRRERPHMVVDSVSGAPLAVSNGVQECFNTGPCPTYNDRSWTLVQATRQ